MAIKKKSFRPAIICCVMGLVHGTAVQSIACAENSSSPDDAYLDQLEGEWDMTGTMLGKPVRYHARGDRVLEGGFLRFHMIDAGAVPTYEADVYLGFDAHAGDYVAHWLDRFGAAGARVVATGKREGQRLVLFFPYSDGAFRDTFTYEPKARTWSWLLESQAKNGAWSRFASYTLIRPGG